MLRVRIVGVALASLLAVAVFGSATASAKERLRLYNEQGIKVDIPSRVFIEGNFNVEPFSTTPPGSHGSVECSGGVRGELESNDESKDQISIISAYKGLAGVECGGHSVVASGFPWTLRLGGKPGTSSLSSVMEITLESCTYKGRMPKKSINLQPSYKTEIHFSVVLNSRTRGCEKHLLFQTTGEYENENLGTWFIANANGPLSGERF
jgi:hypothetical protein